MDRGRSTVFAFAIVACLVMHAATTPALADTYTGTGYVATANGNNAFEISNGGSQVEYDVQPDTVYNWYYQDGSLVTYTSSGVTANRDGMKTFAATDAAFGQTIGSLKLTFDYASDDLTNGDGYPYGNYPGINVHITDGAGTYAIWSATSGGTGFTWGTPVSGRAGWETLTLDCTTFSDTSVFGKINESTNQGTLVNGNLNGTAVQWSDIKDWTIAGFYTEQFAPTGDWGAWGENLWSDISEAGDTTPENQFGVSLFWGDTVGSMLGDYDETYVGASAERPYGQKVKAIDNVVVGFGGDIYEIDFQADAVPVPAPGSVALLVTGLLAVYRRRKK